MAMVQVVSPNASNSIRPQDRNRAYQNKNDWYSYSCIIVIYTNVYQSYSCDTYTNVHQRSSNTSQCGRMRWPLREGCSVCGLLHLAHSSCCLEGSIADFAIVRRLFVSETCTDTKYNWKLVYESVVCV